jgi:hypothetical protein
MIYWWRDYTGFLIGVLYNRRTLRLSFNKLMQGNKQINQFVGSI